LTNAVPPPQPTPRRRVSAEALRILFLRMLSPVLLAVGVLEWAELLGAVHLDGKDFFADSLQGQAMVVFFAVADLVAAVGLWLTANWGIVIWLATAFARIARRAILAASVSLDMADAAAEVIAIAVFLVLVVLAMRERRQEIARQRESRRDHARE
jgi:Family of unknown function (DUF6163)